MGNIVFNANEYEAYEEFEPLPEGKYAVYIDTAEIKVPKSGNGKMLSLRYVVIEGEYRNRLIFENLNIYHANEKAAYLAKKRLTSICNAVGVPHLTDSSQLREIPMTLRVKVKKDEEGRYSNIISGYEAYQTPRQQYASQQTNSQSITQKENLETIYSNDAPPYAVDKTDDDIPF